MQPAFLAATRIRKSSRHQGCLKRAHNFREKPIVRYRLALLLLAAIAAGACSERTLSAERAANLIARLDGFKREAHFTIYAGVPLRSTFTCLSQAEVERAPLNRFAMGQGWVRYETRSADFGLGGKATCPAMALTAAGEAASPTWTRGRVPSDEGVAWMIPIGRRELIAVRDLTEGPDGSTQVKFDWKWTPNATGTALRRVIAKANPFFDEPRMGRALCRRPDGGWRCQLPSVWATPADVLGEFRP